MSDELSELTAPTNPRHERGNAARDRQQRAERARRAWRLRIERGMTEYEIGQEMGVDYRLIHKDIAKMEKEVQERFLQNATRHKVEQLAQLDMMLLELFAAWTRSQDDSIEVTTGLALLNPRDGEVRPLPDKVVRKGQTGQVAYITAALKILEDKRKIAGLNAPDQVDVTVSDETVESTLRKRLKDLADRAIATQQTDVDVTVIEEEEETPRQELKAAAAKPPKTLVNPLTKLLPSQRADTAEGRDV